VIITEAYAKINLTLEVLSKRSDGYHEIRSVMQSISLCDRLIFEDSLSLNFQCALSDWVAGKSLVNRAAELLMRHMGKQYGANVTLEKHIPLSSGLGGDSSDAAAVLCGLVRLWGVHVPTDDLMRLAAELGSDVPYFISGSTALARGRGDAVSALPHIHRTWLVLVFPNVKGPSSKTSTMYSLLRQEHFTQGGFTDTLVTRLISGAPIVSGDLFNVFENVAWDVFPNLEYHRMEFQRVAGMPVHLAGAGPTLFALFNNERHAAQTQRRLRDAGMNTCLCTTCGFVPDSLSS